MNSQRKKVLIIEDDKIIRESFTHIVDSSDRFITVGAYSSAEAALDEVSKKCPDIVLMDIQLPKLNGVAATGIIKNQYPHIEVVIVTVHEDNRFVFEALKAGASGYITKSSNYLEVIRALDDIVKGGAPMSTKIARMVVHNFHLNPDSPLSKREREVLLLLSEGKTYSQISDQLFVSKETAKTHIRNIYTKLQVNKKSDALQKAVNEKLI